MADFREDKVVKSVLDVEVVNNIINGRVYPIMTPPKEIFPCVVYSLVSVNPTATSDGETTEADYFIELMILYKPHLNHEQDRTLFGAVEDAMNRYTGTVDNTAVDATFLQGKKDEVFGDDMRAFGRVLTYKLMLRKV